MSSHAYESDTDTVFEYIKSAKKTHSYLEA